MRKKLVKTVAVVFCMLTVCSYKVFAAPHIDAVTMFSGVITILGTIDTKEAKTVTFMAFPKDKLPTKENLAALGEVQAADGKFKLSLEIDMSDDYTFIVKEGGVTDSYSISYTNRTALSDFTDNIKRVYASGIIESEEKAAKNIEALFSMDSNKNVLESLGIDSVKYYAVMDKAQLFKIFVKNTNFSTLTVEDVANGYKTAYNMVLINTGKEDAIEEALISYNFVFEEEPYNSIETETAKKWVIKLISENGRYMLYDELEKSYRTALMLYNINNEIHTNKIHGLIGNYATELGIINDPIYTRYKDDGKVNAALIARLAKSPAVSADELLLIIRDACANESAVASPTGGVGGSVAASRTVGVQKDTEKIEEDKPDASVGKFYDMGEATWALEAVESLYDRGIVSGYGDGSFAPNNSVTREEFIKMLVVAFNVPYEDKVCSFLDVFKDDWFYGYVCAAEAAGITKGQSENFFGVFQNITRQDAFVMLMRSLVQMGCELEEKREYRPFDDEGAVESYAIGAIKALYVAEIVDGDENGLVNPLNKLTRAEAAKIIYGMMREAGL